MNTPEGEAAMATIQSMREHTKQVYSKIVEKGGELPADGKLNLQNLAPTIKTIKQGGGDGTLWGTLYDISHPEGRQLAFLSDYMALANSTDTENTLLSFSFGLLRKSEVTGYTFGAACTFAPNNFCRSLPNLTKFGYTEVLQEIGDNFLYASPITPAKFNQPINLPNVRTIGGNFLRYQQALASTLKLGNRLESIGVGFMYDNYAFNSSLTIPASVKSIGTEFMFRPNNFTGILRVETTVVPEKTDTDGADTLCVADSSAPAYQQGVRITGPGAAAWKEALPDRTGADGLNRRRKLILVEN